MWVVAWLYERTGLSVLIMLTLLISLIVLLIRHNLERWDAPLRIIAFVWWPICWYLGWIILATVTNIAAWLVSLDYLGEPLGQEGWTITMMMVATIIYLLLIFTRNMREASLVGIWGLIAIAVRHWQLIPAIAYVAIAAALVLFVSSAYHGFKNRATSPMAKWKRGEF